MERVVNYVSKKTKIDFGYVYKHGSLFVVERFTTILMSLLVSIACAHLLSKDVYGTYKYLLSIGSILTVFSLTGLESNVLRATAKGYEGTWLQSVKLYFTWCLGIVFVGFLLGGYYIYLGNMTLGIALMTVSVASPLIQGFGMFRAYLYGRKLFSEANKLNIVYSIVPNMLFMGSMFLTNNIAILASVFFLSSAFMLTVQFYYVKKRFAPNTTQDPHTWQLGKHMSIMNVYAVIAGKIDGIILFQFIGSTQLAIYSFAIAIPEIIRGSFKIIQTIAIPKIIQSTSLNIKRKILYHGLIFSIFAGAITIVYILLAPYIFSFLFPQYQDAVRFSQVFALTILLNALFASSFFEAEVAIKYRYMLNIFSNTTIIISLAVLTYFFGLWGAIWARVISRVLIVSFTTFLLLRYKSQS
jgi:O-antigen/teichoic acid export membrane protein